MTTELPTKRTLFLECDLLNDAPWELSEEVVTAPGTGIEIHTAKNRWIFGVVPATELMRSSREEVLMGYLSNLVLVHTTDSSKWRYISSESDAGLWLPLYQRQPMVWTHQGRLHETTTPVESAMLLIPNSASRDS